MKISYLNISRQFEPQWGLNTQEIEKVLFKHSDAEQNQVEKLEKELARWTNRSHAVAVGSGTDAVYLALKALNIGKGDEIVVTALSFIASASGIIRTGAKPIFVDIDPKTYLMDIKLLETSLSKRTKAIMAVHLYGQCVPIDPLVQFCKEKGLPLIEDSAQALGATYKNQSAGGFGDIACISFNPTKVIGGIESGGAVLCNSKEQAQFIQEQRYHGKSIKTELVYEQGLLSKMSEHNALLLRQKISTFPKWQKRRDEVASFYDRELAHIEDLATPYILKENKSNWHKYVIRTSKRDKLKKFLKKEGIETKIHYPVALPREPVFSCSDTFSYAEKASLEILSLPMYPQLLDIEVEKIVSSINDFFLRSKGKVALRKEVVS